MPSFQFLPFNLLEEKTVNLLDAVAKKHEETKREITGSRQVQIEMIKKLFNQLRMMTTGGVLADIYELHNKNLGAYYEQLAELDEISELTAEQKLLKRKLKHEKYALMKVVYETNTWKSNKQTGHQLTDEQRAVIATGALLHIKDLIDYEYSGPLNKMLGVIVTNKPQNSTLYAGINAAIGVTTENELDEQTKKQALAAYNQFIGIIEQINKFDRTKMNKTATEVKDSIYPYADMLQNPYFFLTNPSEEVKKHYGNADLRPHALDVKDKVVKNINEDSQSELIKTPYRHEESVLGVVRNATTEEIETYKDPSKVKESWKGVAEVAVEKIDGVTPDEAKKFNTATFFNQNLCSKINVSSMQNTLKHVEPAVKVEDQNRVKYSKR